MLVPLLTLLPLLTFCSRVLVLYPYKCVAFMWQLADEAIKLFDATIAYMEVTINYSPDGQDPIPSISKYIETMRISL
jgi:hypothetical protein